MFEVTDLAVCTVCIHILANGEFDDGTSAGYETSRRMAHKWGDDVVHLVPGGDELGFSHRACDGCGCVLSGDRFTASALIPSAPGAMAELLVLISRGDLRLMFTETIGVYPRGTGYHFRVSERADRTTVHNVFDALAANRHDRIVVQHRAFIVIDD